MSRPPRRVALIGLDCAPPALVFGPLRDQLPHLAGLMARGRWGRLASTIPPITVPAWAAMTTGRDPGELGIYGFRNRAGADYRTLATASARSVTEPALWDLAGRAGLTSVVLGVPLTWPPREIRGAMVAGFPVPEGAPLASPRSLGPRLERWAGGPYLPDVPEFRTRDKAGLLADLGLMTRRRFAVAQGLYRLYDPEVFMMVEMGPDRLHHGFWSAWDPDHPNHRPGGPWASAIPDYYRELDGLIGGLLARLAPETLVMVVSDHGARAMQGGVLINEWLIRRGFLVLKRRPMAAARLDPDLVDWPATRAWADGGYYARVFLNLAGREPDGALASDQVEPFLRELAAELTAMPGPDGAPLGNRVHDPRRVYARVSGLAPDLILYPGDLAWRALATVHAAEGGPMFSRANDAGPDEANHDRHGVLIAAPAAGRLAEAGSEAVGASILDVLPSALAWLGVEPPPGLTGRAWEWIA